LSSNSIQRNIMLCPYWIMEWSELERSRNWEFIHELGWYARKKDWNRKRNPTAGGFSA